MIRTQSNVDEESNLAGEIQQVPPVVFVMLPSGLPDLDAFVDYQHSIENWSRNQASSLPYFVVRVHLVDGWKGTKHIVKNKLPLEEFPSFDELVLDEVLENFRVLNALLKFTGNDLGVVGEPLVVYLGILGLFIF